MKRILLLVLVVLSLANCNSTKQPLKAKVIKSNEDITLFYSKKMKTIWAISLPIYTKISNPSSERKAFLHYKYIYGNELKGKAMKLYLIEKEKLLKQSVSKVKYIDAKSSKKYLITSKHFVDTTKFNRSFFKPYIEKMTQLKQDTLNIGTMSEFAIKHNELQNWLTKNDSISIQTLKSKSKFGKTIKIPVEY